MTTYNEVVKKITENLLADRARFLAFVRSRVESDEAAEEVLQAAYVKGLKQGNTVRDDEKVTAWFYRLLRNAITDHYRRRGARERAMEQLKAVSKDREDEKLEKAVCKCVHGVIDKMKPEYADILKKIEMEEAELKGVAKKLGVSPGNAAVRLHRARRTLKESLLQTCGACAAHGCLDCSCKQV